MSRDFDHSEMVEAGAYWLNKTDKHNPQIILKEFHCSIRCVPDVWSFGKSSIQIEAKASRSDFLKDSEKWVRYKPEHDVGTYRYYCCPHEMIDPDELPEKWGLIFVRNVKDPDLIVEAEPQKCSKRDETKILYSLLRREAVDIDPNFEYLHGSSISY